MPSTVRTARAPTDLKPNLIRVKKRDDERAHRREGGERVKEFQHLGTSDRVVGRPRSRTLTRGASFSIDIVSRIAQPIRDILKTQMRA